MRYMAVVKRPEGPEGIWSVENIDAEELLRVISLGCIPVGDSIPDTRGLRWMAYAQNRVDAAIKQNQYHQQMHPLVKTVTRWVVYWMKELIRPR